MLKSTQMRSGRAVRFPKIVILQNEPPRRLALSSERAYFPFTALPQLWFGHAAGRLGRVARFQARSGLGDGRSRAKRTLTRLFRTMFTPETVEELLQPEAPADEDSRRKGNHFIGRRGAQTSPELHPCAADHRQNALRKMLHEHRTSLAKRFRLVPKPPMYLP